MCECVCERESMYELACWYVSESSPPLLEWCWCGGPAANGGSRFVSRDSTILQR